MKKIVSGKFRKIGLLLGCAMFLLTACGKKADEIEVQIKAEFFDQETEIGRLLSEHVAIDVKKIEDDYAFIDVTAPNVTDALLEWYEENEFTEAGFDAALEAALKQEDRVREYQLLIREDGSIEYSDAFINRVTAGLPEFYYKIQFKAVEEVKEAADE